MTLEAKTIFIDILLTFFAENAIFLSKAHRGTLWDFPSTITGQMSAMCW